MDVPISVSGELSCAPSSPCGDLEGIGTSELGVCSRAVPDAPRSTAGVLGGVASRGSRPSMLLGCGGATVAEARGAPVGSEALGGPLSALSSC